MRRSSASGRAGGTNERVDAVNVVNTSYIESMGLSYKISDGYDTIAVTVRGNRSLVESLTASRFNVTADLTQIISLETEPVMVPLTVDSPRISSENLTASPRNINIDIEEMVSKEFVINATASGTTPANGFEVGEMTVKPETVTIRGPGTLIDKIERVNLGIGCRIAERKCDCLRCEVRCQSESGDER